MFTFIGALRSTCVKNNKLCVCPKYKQFISRIKDYNAAMYEIITGYFSIDNNKLLLCYAAEDDATGQLLPPKGGSLARQYRAKTCYVA